MIKRICWAGLGCAIATAITSAAPARAHDGPLSAADPARDAGRSSEEDTAALEAAANYHGLAGGKPIPEEARHLTKMFRTELGKFNLGNSLKGLNRRYARTRFWRMEPGGIIPYHEHVERPTFVYLLQGEVTEYKRGVDTPRVFRQGELSPEDASTGHWWKNVGKEDVLMIAVDVFKPGELDPHEADVGVKSESLAEFDLRTQFRRDPLAIPDGSDYRMGGRRLTIAPGGSLKQHLAQERPAVVCVIKGRATEHVGDPEGPIPREERHCSLYDAGAEYYWTNDSREEAVLFEVAFFDRTAADGGVTVCTADTDCALGNKCEPSTGKCVSGATCDGNHTVTGVTGQSTDCSPYKCTQAGACLQKCNSAADCVSSAVCNTGGSCMAPPSSGGASAEPSNRCGCLVVGGSDSLKVPWAVGGVAILALWRRRRDGLSTTAA